MLSTVFVVKDYLLQSGSLQIFELPTGTLLETIKAHSKSLWAIAIHPNQVSN